MQEFDISGIKCIWHHGFYTKRHLDITKVSERHSSAVTLPLSTTWGRCTNFLFTLQVYKLIENGGKWNTVQCSKFCSWLEMLPFLFAIQNILVPGSFMTHWKEWKASMASFGYHLLIWYFLHLTLTTEQSENRHCTSGTHGKDHAGGERLLFSKAGNWKGLLAGPAAFRLNEVVTTPATAMARPSVAGTFEGRSSTPKRTIFRHQRCFPLPAEIEEEGAPVGDCMS